MKSKITASALLVIGLIIGASALSAYADWSAPTANPPTCPTGSPGCDAPLNVGATSQTKLGPLTLNFNNLLTVGLKVLGKIQIVDGNQADGKVLTSDASGIASWQTPTGGDTSSQQCGMDGLVNIYPDVFVDDWGTAATNDSLVLYCRNHTIRYCLLWQYAGGEACPWKTNIASDDAHTCAYTSLTTGVGTGTWGEWNKAPASLWLNNTITLSNPNNFNPAGKNVFAYLYPTSTWYTCVNGQIGTVQSLP